MTKEVFDRMAQEYTELTEKLQKVHAFVTDDEKMKGIDQINQDLLVAQMNAMSSYATILRIRLGVNNKPEFSESTSSGEE